MSESRMESDGRLSYQAPEIRSLGTIAEITAANPGFGIDSNGYSTDHGASGPSS